MEAEQYFGLQVATRKRSAQWRSHSGHKHSVDRRRNRMAYRRVALVGRAVERHFAEYRGRIGFELRVTTLGHIQRGGIPSSSDRLLATISGWRCDRAPCPRRTGANGWDFEGKGRCHSGLASRVSGLASHPLTMLPHRPYLHRDFSTVRAVWQKPL
jgi:hypothetical protein